MVDTSLIWEKSVMIEMKLLEMDATFALKRLDGNVQILSGIFQFVNSHVETGNISLI